MSKSKLSSDHRDRLERKKRRDELEMSRRKAEFKKKIDEFYKEREDERLRYLKEKEEVDQIADFIKPRVAEVGWEKAEEEAAAIFGQERIDQAKTWISNLKSKNIN